MPLQVSRLRLKHRLIVRINSNALNFAKLASDWGAVYINRRAAEVPNVPLRNPDCRNAVSERWLVGEHVGGRRTDAAQSLARLGQLAVVIATGERP